MIHHKIWLGTLALSTIGGCARAQPPATTNAQQPVAPNAPPQFVAPAPFETTVWRVGQKGLLKLAGPLQGYAGAVSALDSTGKVVWTGNAVAGKAQLEIPVAQIGLYTLKAGDKKFSFAVVPVPLPKAQQVEGRALWGVNTHFAQRETADEAYKMLQIAGVDAVRDELGWGAIEKTQGVYQFPARHLEYTAKLKQYGIPLWFSASYGNPLYPQVARYPAAGAAQPYGRYVVEALKKFGDNIAGVEILNEPNKVDPVTDYLPVLKSTWEQVRAAGFKQPIIAVGGAGPAGGGMQPGFARQLLQAGGAAYCDGFSQHPYMTPFTPDTGYAGGAAHLDAALNRAGDVVENFKLKGSWITEVGWPAIPSDVTPTAEEMQDQRGARPMVSEKKQAAFVARTLLGASKYPHLRGLFIYDFQDDGPIPLRREHKFGLVRQNLEPKMSFQAFAVASNFLKDKTFESRVFKHTSLLTANLYRDEKGILWAAVWSLEASRKDLADANRGNKQLPNRPMELEHRVPFRIVGAKVQSATDWQGAPLAEAQTSAATSLPMYLNLGPAAADVTLEPVLPEPTVEIKEKAEGTE